MPPPSSLGIALGLFTAVCWAISPLCFASAGRRVGSVPVALVRILLAAVVLLIALPIYSMLKGGVTAPSPAATGWICLSAFLGIAMGDLLSYESLVTLGPRRTTQLCTLGPVAAVLTSYLVGEHLTARQLLGVILVLASTAVAVFARPGTPAAPAPSPRPNTGEKDTRIPAVRTEPGRFTALGLLYGSLGAIFTGVSTVATRQAFRTDPHLDTFLATTLRVSTAAAMVWLIPITRGEVRKTWAILRHPEVRPRLLAGTAVGPLTGMVTCVWALKLAPAGVVSTLLSTSPLVVMPWVALRYKARLGWTAPLAAAVACAGIAVIFW